MGHDADDRATWPGIPGYRLLAVLGHGLSGTVYRARREADGVPAAVKVLAPDADETLRERFRLEIRLLREAPHEALVPLLGAGPEFSPPYLVMTLMERGNLRRRLEAEGALPPGELLEMALRLTRALAHLHERGVLHRDMKPENVLLDGGGRTFLGDLGLGKDSRRLDLTRSGILLGTPPYLPPEVRAGAPATAAGDLFSLAVLLVEAATGERPEVTIEGVAGAGDRLARIRPPGLAAALRVCLRTEPEDRPADARALLRRLEELGVSHEFGGAGASSLEVTRTLSVGQGAVEDNPAQRADEPSSPGPGVQEGAGAGAVDPESLGSLLQAAPRYRPIRILGRGGMGSVWLVQDIELGRCVALKVLAARARHHAEARQRIEREARVQACIRHAHVAGLYDVLTDEDRIGLVMEYVEGQDLAVRIRTEGPLDPMVALRLCRDVGGALDFLHAGRVVHRDLKPANLMVRDRDESWVLMDLGLARVRGQETMTATDVVLGTPQYFAPEMVRGEAASPRTDLFQLGACLLEGLTGRPLVEAGSMHELMNRILDGDWTEFPEDLALPDAPRRVLRRAVSVDPRARQASGAELTEELEASLGLSVSHRATVGSWLPAAPVQGGGRPDREAGGERRGGRGGLVVRGVALAAGLVILFSLLGELLGPGVGMAPRDLRWRVIGNALVVDLSDEPSEELTLLFDGEPVEVERIPTGEGGWRLVHRGLSVGRDRRARLRWSGGESPVLTVRGEGPAVGPLRLGGGDGLQLEVRRACRVRWAAGPAEVFEPGRRILPVPRLPRPEVLLVEEEGLVVRLDVSWPALLREARARLVEVSEGKDPTATYREMGRMRPSMPASERRVDEEVFPREREVVRDLLGWIPVLLEEELGKEEQRRLFALWQAWSQSVPQERLLGPAPEPLSLSPGVPGSLSMGLPPWPDAVHRSPALEPVPPDALRHPVGLNIRTPGVARVFSDRHDRTATAARFLWPADLPAGGGPTALSLFTRRFEEVTYFEIHTVDGGKVRLWHPRTTYTLDALFDGGAEFCGWLTVVLPALLVPGRGTEVEVLLRPAILAPELPAYIAAPFMANVYEIRISRPRSGRWDPPGEGQERPGGREGDPEGAHE